ncbi:MULTISPECIES: flagellar motor protein PomA [Marinobacter]|uniref:Chemotaxis protein MotA n=4 Tax=Marinobacter nauticus TaxID=2743 RepID=A0A368V315_MARNT|nr:MULTISPECIES: flagellar motor protein PomA [Marinobacter]MCG8521257.1 flagellar motor protein PomA [Pseudomonadales bacterium]MEC7432613.1 flagellar motor protein PomA [Pseudomonadota bacterium]ERS11560.1 flagellar motor protein PomA [Marinobacter sp. EN3]ERS82184.1 flagellar motor protein PomA [Marinobacter sp. C1S70]ERS88134.1 flagellar motor protein PomA [Marinobacter sp. EVN1]
MDFATLIGLVGAILLISSAIILGASPGMFINPPSLLIVIGGTLLVVLAKFSLAQFFDAFKVAARAFKFKLPETQASIEELVEIASIARKEGVLGIEGREVSSPFLGQGIQMLVDGQDGNTIKQLLNKERLMTLEHNRSGAKVFTAMADVAPAMGMIGTLIGLVQMLSNMEDPKSIGPAMAVALLTTLYGAMIATMIATPIADKLSLRMTEEARMQSLYIDALVAIQEGTNPRIIEQMLSSYLSPKERARNGDAETAGG